MNYYITHALDKKRFELELEGEYAYVEYELHDEGLDITHTVVPKSLEGRGIAGAMVKKAYDYALSEGLKPAATCSYAIVWLERHPEYKVVSKKKILFVCLGNICRSPSAEAIMKKKVEDRGLSGRIFIDSAGTAGYHEGDLPDSRMRAHASRRGYSLVSRSRPVKTEDFFDFDIIIGMDDSNIEALKQKAPDIESEKKIHRMTDFSRNKLYDHVPDPYYGGTSGFELVLDLLEDSCEGLLESIL
jgi:Protein-tyrosine-phosphatase